MTPKEKALELVRKYSPILDMIPWASSVKQCALIVVDEIIKVLPQSEYLEDRLEMVENRELIYWREVKQEIENL